MKYEFHTASHALEIAKKYRITISELAKRYESERAQKSTSTIRNKMKVTRDVMYDAVKRGVKSSHISQSGMSGTDAHKMFNSLEKMDKMMGNKTTIRAMAYAMAVGEENSRMGRIVAFPTAGGAGVVPGVLFSCSEHFKAGKRRLLRGMFTAAAVGLLIAENATISAAKGGCQAEVGAAAAMAAAGLTEMRNGTPHQCFDAAAIALKSYLGLACDTIGGLVEVPCIKRNAIGCMAAIGASDIVMSGIKSYVPFDEVVKSMNNIAQMMSPKIRETAMGGLAVTKTGNKIKRKYGLPINDEI
ncbi:MAG: L-serine ammonia-lyase, iron-sulfur-dependent, subunit alpha [Candidatus Peregrinibacteria bacterium]